MPAAPGRSSDRFDFHLFEPDAAIEIASDQAGAVLHEEAGTQITVESNQVTGVLLAELTSLGVNRFEARPRCHDSGSSIPSKLNHPICWPNDHYPRGTGPQLLHVKLARPMTAQRPLRLVIRAHYRRPANHQALGKDFFRLASFPEVRDGRRLVAVRIKIRARSCD